ncbi:MAG: tetratricopeptide repeat protein [Phycisphaeraceae bacterium]
MVANNQNKYLYWAFISYSSKDVKTARTLHKSIESFGIPSALISHPTPTGEPTPKRLRPIFRDRDELPASSNLGREIENALTRSRYLIVLCSPNSANSVWVNREIQTFIEMGRRDQILALILAGEPNSGGSQECFPPSLLQTEPIAADLRPGTDGWLDAKLKLIAGMLGVGFDSLKRRDLQRRARRMRITAAVLLIVATAFAGLGLYSNFQRLAAIDARIQAEERRAEAEEARAAEELARLAAEEAEKEERKRAEELEMVSRFQADRLADINPHAMGVMLNQKLKQQLDEVGRRQRIEHNVIEAEKQQLDVALRNINLTDASMQWLDSMIFQRSLKAIYESFDDQPMVKARLLQSTAITMQNIGLIDQAIIPMRKAMVLYQKHLGEDNIRTLISLNQYAMMLHINGKSEEAVSLLHLALAYLREIQTPDDPSSSENLHAVYANLGSVLQELGRQDEAEPILIEALTQSHQDYGPHSIQYAMTASNLGMLRLMNDRLDEAAPLIEAAYEAAKSLQSPDKSNELIIANNLAQLRRKQGRLEEANQLMDFVRVARLQTLGEDHPDSILSLINQAAAKGEQNDYEGSVNQLEDALRRSLELYGKDNRITYLAQSNLGAIYLKLQIFDEAEPLLLAAYEGRLEMYGPKHLDTLASLSKLGALRLRQSRFEEALDLYRQCSKIVESEYGPDHLISIESLNGRGAATMKIAIHENNLDLLEEADRLIAESDARLIRTGRIETIERYTLLLNRGTIAMYRNDLVTAERLMRLAFKGMVNLLGRDNDGSHLCMINLAMILELQGQIDEAVQYYQEYIDRAIKLTSNQPDIMALFLNNKGIEAMEPGAYTGASMLLDKASHLAILGYGKTHIETQTIRYNHFFALAQLEQYQDCEEVARSMIKDLNLAFPGQPSITIEWEYYLLTVLNAQEKWDEAERISRAPLNLMIESGDSVNEHQIRLERSTSLTGLKRFAEAEQEALKAYTYFNRTAGKDDASTYEAILYLLDVYDAWVETDTTGRAAREAERLRSSLPDIND